MERVTGQRMSLVYAGAAGLPSLLRQVRAACQRATADATYPRSTSTIAACCAADATALVQSILRPGDVLHECPERPASPLANSRGPVAPPPPPGPSRPSRPPGEGARGRGSDQQPTAAATDRWDPLISDPQVGTYAFLRTLRGDEFSFRPPALDDVKRATCDTKHAYTTLAKKVASRIAGPSPAGWPSSQPKVDAAALVLIFERLIFHKGRFGVEVLELSNWRSVIKRRVQRFAAGAVRELWEEAHQAVVRRAPQHAQPDQFSAATPLPGAASVARVARLAEQAVADGNLSRGLQRILSQLNPRPERPDGPPAVPRQDIRGPAGGSRRPQGLGIGI